MNSFPCVSWFHLWDCLGRKAPFRTTVDMTWWMIEVVLVVFLSSIHLRRFSKLLMGLGSCTQFNLNYQRAKQLKEQFSYTKRVVTNQRKKSQNNSKKCPLNINVYFLAYMELIFSEGVLCTTYHSLNYFRSFFKVTY